MRTSMGGIFRLKPSDSHQRPSLMPRVLTAAHLVPMGVGATIGAGVYVLVGTAAREKAGPALPLSFLISGTAAALAALCYAELASRCPSAGSAYHYAYICIGEVVAWMIGWGLILEYTVGAAAVARGVSPNLQALFGGPDSAPIVLHRLPFFSTGIELDLIAALMVGAITTLLCAGIKESATFQAVMVACNVLVLLFVVLVGTWAGFASAWQGYRLDNGYAPNGVNGILGGAAMVFFAYIGFDAVASTAEEVKKPQRDLPLGIGLSLLCCAALYMAVSAVLVGLVPYNQIDLDTPISSAFATHGMHWAMYVVAIGATAALTTTLLGSLLPQPRVLMAMARDGLLPPWFSHIHATRATPVNATVAAGLLAAAMSATMSIDQLSGMVSVGTLLAFTAVSAALLVLRYVPPPVPAPPPLEVELSAPDRGVHSPPRVRSPVHRPSDSGVALLAVERDEDEGGGVKLQRVGSGGGVDGGELSRSGSGVSLGGSEKAKRSTAGEEELKEHRNRRRQAARGVALVMAGAPLLSLGAAADLLPSVLRWLLSVAGAPILGMGLVMLTRLEEDPGAAAFGSLGGFRCPWVPALPVASVLVNCYLMVNLGLGTWFRVSIWLLVGGTVYALYGRTHSVLAPEVGVVALVPLGANGKRGRLGEAGLWTGRTGYAAHVDDDDD